ncbi:MAG: ATP-binding protein [Myxococcaceae bacterium]
MSAESPTPLRLLLVEDSEDDAELVSLALRREGFAPRIERVETEPAMLDAMARGPWDAVITDYNLPQLSAQRSLEVALSREDIPVIVASGTIGEERAVELLKNGASDVVMKQNLARLGPSLRRALSEARVRREKREAMEALRRAVDVRDQFVAIAAHELRTPLTALHLQIEGMVQLIEEGGEADSVRRRLSTVQRSTTRLSCLFERLLDVTLIAGGGLILQSEPCDLVELVRTAAENLRAGAVLTNALEIEENGPVIGNWDRIRIEIVVSNLLTNAAKYGAELPIHVQVRQRCDRAVLRVRDQGIGISAEDQERIFERFERAVPDNHYGGFGLGLWIAREIIQAHGGQVSVESSIAKGSVFTVELPLNVAAAPSASL